MFWKRIVYIILSLLFVFQRSAELPEEYKLWNKSVDLITSQKYKDALVILDKLKYIVTDSLWRSDVYLNLGYVQYKLGEKLKALSSFSSSLLLNDNNELARKNYELLLRELPPPPEDEEIELEFEVPPVKVPKENSGQILEFKYKLTEKEVLNLIQRMRSDSSYYYVNIKINLGNSTSNTPAR